VGKIANTANSLDIFHVGALDVVIQPSMPGSPEFSNEVKHRISVVKTMTKVRVRLRPIARLAQATDRTGWSGIPLTDLLESKPDQLCELFDEAERHRSVRRSPKIRGEIDREESTKEDHHRGRGDHPERTRSPGCLWCGG
jgi:hypothetical protein